MSDLIIWLQKEIDNYYPIDGWDDGYIAGLRAALQEAKRRLNNDSPS